MIVVLSKYPHRKACDHLSRKRDVTVHSTVKNVSIMLVCKREKFSGPRMRNMRMFGNFSCGIPRRNMSDNNFASRIHVVSHIYLESLMEVSFRINDIP